MAYYEIQPDLKVVTTQILNTIQILGSETFLVIELIKAIQDDKNAPYHELDEKLAKFLIEKINKSTFLGSAAIQISKLIITLSKPMQEIPNQQKPNPPQPLPKKKS